MSRKLYGKPPPPKKKARLHRRPTAKSSLLTASRGITARRPPSKSTWPPPLARTARQARARRLAANRATTVSTSCGPLSAARPGNDPVYVLPCATIGGACPPSRCNSRKARGASHSSPCDRPSLRWAMQENTLKILARSCCCVL